MNGIDKAFGLSADSLVLRSRRMHILQSNIANAATPGYKARDIDFFTEIRKKQRTSGPMRTSDDAHINYMGTMSNGKALYRESTSPSIDGNTVELHQEQVQYAENAARYQTSLEFLNSRISGIKKAFKGE